MRAARLRIGSAPIPFRVRFGHAAAERSVAENVLVHVEDANGHFGLGEGCPRVYVTGETVPSALAFLKTHQASLLAIDGLDALRIWATDHAGEIDANPSAFCAAELALIDLFARQAGVGIETLLDITGGPSVVAASAVVGTGHALKFHLQAWLYGLVRMHDAKLKLSGDSAQDLPRAQVLARRGRLRLDANNLWRTADAAIAPLTALARHAWAIEEPIAPRDWDGMKQIHQATGMTIILDESFTALSDLHCVPQGLPVVPNLRLSKLGGLMRSLDCLGDGTGPVIVGAQVGETSILARAGLTLARAAGSRLCGYEGAYGRLLLREDLAKPSLGFGRGGVVQAALFDAKPGAGLSPQASLFAALADSAQR
jgi:L-alanine-DL-glutamate epimerase-like enolase superfamily enzyme